MDELDASWLPMVKSWRLNEVRFIGERIRCGCLFFLVLYNLSGLLFQFVS
jgi:hypothetical protein